MSSFPTLSMNPSYPLSPDGELEDAVLRSQFASGYEQTRPKFTRARRKFGVLYSAIPDADVAAIKTFELTTIKNGSGAFYWSHPITAATYQVRLTGPITYSHINYGLTEVKMTLQEV